MRQYCDQREELARMAGRTQYPEALARELRHGYLACTSYVDSNVGKMLDALASNGFAENTVVVLCGDHGWNLGDLGIWGKHNTFEFATRVPLMVRLPGQKQPGGKTDALVELLDIYPALAEACGFPMPENLEDKSFVPLLDDPSKDWKTGVLSEYVGKQMEPHFAPR